MSHNIPGDAVFTLQKVCQFVLLGITCQVWNDEIIPVIVGRTEGTILNISALLSKFGQNIKQLAFFEMQFSGKFIRSARRFHPDKLMNAINFLNGLEHRHNPSIWLSRYGKRLLIFSWCKVT
jgi:hypothetical protein